MIKNILKIAIGIIIAIITGHYLSGCATVKDNNIKENSNIVVLPKETEPLVLNKVYYNVITQEGSNYVCVNTKSFNEQNQNYTEIIRYIKQLKNENNSLREIINNK